MTARTYPAGTVIVSGAEFDVRVNDEGNWLVELPSGDHVFAPTRDGLKTELAGHVRRSRTKVAVPFLVKQLPAGGDFRVRRATATGIDGRTRGILAVYDDTGEPANVNSLGAGTVLAADADPDEWERLLNEYHHAAQAMHRYQEAHKVESLHRLVREAVTAELTRQGV